MAKDPNQRQEPQVLTTALEQSVTVISLLGEHDGATAEGVKNTLSSLLHARAGLVVDLTETRFFDSSIMHVLEESQRLASRNGARVSFHVPARSIVTRVFSLLGALDAWPVHRTREGAIEAVHPGIEVTDGGR